MRKILMSLFAVLLVAAIWAGATFLDRHRDQTETIERLRYQLNELKTVIARSEEPQDTDPAVQACLEEVRTAHKGNVQQVTEDLVRAASGQVTGEVAEDQRIRVSLLTALLWLARKEHASRIEAMAANDAFGEQAQTLAKQAADNTRQRP